MSFSINESPSFSRSSSCSETAPLLKEEGGKPAALYASIVPDLHKSRFEKPASTGFSYLGIGPFDCSADYSYTIRQAGNNLGYDDASFPLMGTTTALNTLTGAVAMINAKQRFDLASNVSYSEGMVESGIEKKGTYTKRASNFAFCV